eukprot:2581444-Lingulodinium_polyedra.AAC.1
MRASRSLTSPPSSPRGCIAAQRASRSAIWLRRLSTRASRASRAARCLSRLAADAAGRPRRPLGARQ